jgi:hypothetical protein
MLKFYEIEGRFPAYGEEVPPAAVGYLASLVKVDPALFAKYAWKGRSIECHRAQVRRVYGTRGPAEDEISAVRVSTCGSLWLLVGESSAGWQAGRICPAPPGSATGQHSAPRTASTVSMRRVRGSVVPASRHARSLPPRCSRWRAR